MDANPWLYALTAKELSREGKIDARCTSRCTAASRSRAASCTSRAAARSATSRSRSASASAHRRGRRADRGRGYGIVRDGCFRGADAVAGDAARERTFERLRVRAIRAARRAARRRRDHHAHQHSCSCSTIASCPAVDRELAGLARAPPRRSAARDSRQMTATVRPHDGPATGAAAGPRDARHPQGVPGRHRARRRRSHAARRAKCTSCSARTARASRR